MNYYYSQIDFKNLNVQTQLKTKHQNSTFKGIKIFVIVRKFPADINRYNWWYHHSGKMFNWHTSQHCDKSRTCSSHTVDTQTLSILRVIINVVRAVWCQDVSYNCVASKLQTVQTKGSESEKLETKYFEVKFSTLENRNFLSVESWSAVLKWSPPDNDTERVKLT